jgi:hypothetical protein
VFEDGAFHLFLGLLYSVNGRRRLDSLPRAWSCCGGTEPIRRTRDGAALSFAGISSGTFANSVAPVPVRLSNNIWALIS